MSLVTGPKPIASRDNPFFRSLQKLVRDGGTQRDEHVAVIEGVHLCEAFLDGGGTPRTLVVADGALERDAVRALLTRALERDEALKSYRLDDALFASLSQLEQGVGVLFVIDVPQVELPEAIAATSVLLDRVQDPGNVGSILRSAAAAGIASVYLSRGCAGAWSTKVVRAGMGAHFHLDIAEGCDLAVLLERATVPCLATSPHAPATLDETDLSGDVAWLFGHEGQGVDAALARKARAVAIPQAGRIESLNVAAAAAICFFEQARQRRASLRG